jgi:hypothetical protein
MSKVKFHLAWFDWIVPLLLVAFVFIGVLFFGGLIWLVGYLPIFGSLIALWLAHLLFISLSHNRLVTLGVMAGILFITTTGIWLVGSLNLGSVIPYMWMLALLIFVGGFVGMLIGYFFSSVKSVNLKLVKK